MKGVLRRGVSALCALFLVLGTAACQQKEPKMKDGKILLTVCMESSVGLPNVEKELPWRTPFSLLPSTIRRLSTLTSPLSLSP